MFTEFERTILVHLVEDKLDYALFDDEWTKELLTIISKLEDMEATND